MCLAESNVAWEYQGTQRCSEQVGLQHLSLPVETSPTSTEQLGRQAMLLMPEPKRASPAAPSS